MCPLNPHCGSPVVPRVFETNSRHLSLYLQILLYTSLTNKDNLFITPGY